MSKRLLSEEMALRKIELSLKLQGKCFSGEFLKCTHCKFCWENRNDKPQWTSKYSWHNPPTPSSPPDNPKPEKYHWHCCLYKGTPYHAYLRFKVLRYDQNGNQIPRKPWYNTKELHWDYSPHEGETDKMILVSSGQGWQYSVCRRFEACPPK